MLFACSHCPGTWDRADWAHRRLRISALQFWHWPVINWSLSPGEGMAMGYSVSLAHLWSDTLLRGSASSTPRGRDDRKLCCTPNCPLYSNTYWVLSARNYSRCQWHPLNWRNNTSYLISLCVLPAELVDDLAICMCSTHIRTVSFVNRLPPELQ